MNISSNIPAAIAEQIQDQNYRELSANDVVSMSIRLVGDWAEVGVLSKLAAKFDDYLLAARDEHEEGNDPTIRALRVAAYDPDGAIDILQRFYYSEAQKFVMDPRYKADCEEMFL